MNDGQTRARPINSLPRTGKTMTGAATTCAEVREQGKKLKPAIAAGVGRDEVNIIAGQMLGELLSSPHQWAQAISGGGLAASRVAALPAAMNLRLIWLLLS